MQHLGFYIALAAITVDFMFSANALAYSGVPYTDEGGPLIAKLHPGTYLSAAAMIAQFSRCNSLLTAVGRLVRHDSGLALFIVCIIMCVLFAACLTGLGNIVTLLDTFMPAGMIAVALCDMTVPQTIILARIVSLLLTASATVAIAEAASGFHLIPAGNGELENAAEFRPSGLYDHPLTGAAATMMGLLYSKALIRFAWRRRLFQTWMVIALLAFGGRIALAVTVFAFGAKLIVRLQPRVAARTLALQDFIPLLLFFMVAMPAVMVVVETEWVARLRNHLFWDASAQARIAEFHVLGLMGSDELIFGCKRVDLLALIEPLRLEYGMDVIENFWLLLFVSLGVIGFVPFAVGILGLITWLWQRCNTDGHIVLVSLILVASTSNSLGRKSALLVMLVACLLARPKDWTAPKPTVARQRISNNVAF